MSWCFGGVLQGVNPYQVKEGLEKWILDIPLGIQGAAARLINIDRKRIRENGFHGVSAWMGEQGLPHGQLAAEEKRNEITAEPKLLDMVFREARVSGTDGEWGAESEYTEREFDRETKVRRTLVRYYANSFE